MAFVTRFAPSPTGPLHLGHAYSAILAHDMACAAGGRFLLRMEDTDLERCRPEWDALIQEDLRWLGLIWDGPVLRQAEHIASYNTRLEALETKGLLYPCSCTRSDIRAALAAPQEGVAFNVYPGTCRHRPMESRKSGDALRLNLAAALESLAGVDLCFTETGPAHSGLHRVDPDLAMRQIGDVVLSRKGEDIVAYFLASSFDDADQGVDEIVLGGDEVQVDAGPLSRLPYGLLALLAGGPEPAAELGVARVDHELLARLRVLDHDEAGVW